MKKSILLCLAALIMLLAPSAEAAEKGGPLEPIGAIGGFMDDAGITAEIKVRLVAEKGLDAAAISVTTDNAVVTLEGSVPSQAQAALAERIAGGLSNVKGVRNRLAVRN